MRIADEARTRPIADARAERTGTKKVRKVESLGRRKVESQTGRVFK
jgi:hypothetical protein